MSFFKIAMKYSRVISFLIASTLVIAGCGESKNNNESQASQDESSSWRLVHKKDKMTDAIVISAETQEVSEEFPLTTLAAKVTCVPEGGSDGFQVEITSLSSERNENGVLGGVPIDLDDTPMQMRGLVRLGLNSSGLIPEEFNYSRTTSVAVRINEGLPDNELLPGVAAVSVEFNNEIFIFPFQLESIVKKKIQSMRVMVPTRAGTPNILINFNDSNVSKVVKSCERIRSQINAGAIKLDQIKNDGGESMQASSPAAIAASSPVEQAENPASQAAISPKNEISRDSDKEEILE